MKMEIRGRVFHGNILPLLWTFTPEFGTIVVVSLYTNEEILCTGSREKERVVGTFRGFLKVTIRNIIFKQRERKKKVMSFNDDRLYGVY